MPHSYSFQIEAVCLCRYLLVRLATDLLGEERKELESSRRRGDPPELEEEEAASSAAEPEPKLPLLG